MSVPGNYPPPPSFVPPPIPAYPPASPPASLTEFQYHSQFSSDTVGIVVNTGGVPTDVDAQLVTLNGWLLPAPGTQNPQPVTPVFTYVTTRSAPGVYQYTFSSADTSQVGFYRLAWSFNLNTVPETIDTFIEIGQPSPAYDSLLPPFRTIIEDVHSKMGDMNDSPTGGPNLQVWYQSHYGRGRMAQLLIQAIQHINVAAQPVNNYTATGYDIAGNRAPIFPVAQWTGLLNSALTVEVIKHLMRSYTEDPEIQGAVQARMIRTNYMQRWGTMLSIEQADYKEQRDIWKISQMFKLTPRVLVAGGAYGNYSVIRPIGPLVAQPRFWWRYY